MLDLITKSKIRQKILKHLFSQKDRSFYLSEIAKQAGVSAGTCQRELNRLIKHGLLTSEKKATIRYYSLNQRNPLFDDFKKMVDKTIGIESELRQLVKKIKGLKFAFIFGSYVKGDFGSDSDIDLYLVGDISEDEFLTKLKKIEKTINREINYHLSSELEFKKKLKHINQNSFYKNIIQDHILLTDNIDDFSEFRKLLK